MMKKTKLAEVLQKAIELTETRIKDGTAGSADFTFLQKIASQNNVALDHQEAHGYPYNDPTPMVDPEGDWQDESGLKWPIGT